MRWMQRVYPLTAQDRVLHKSPFGFDVSILELYAPLLVGGQLILAKPDGHQDPDYLLALMRQHAITWVSLSPTLLQMMLHVGGLEQCHSLTRLYLGTENLPLTLLQQLHAAHPVEVINAYGPTECCIQTVTGVIPRGADRIAIGRPVDNVQAYILDVHLQPVPLGAAGELHLGGAQVGLGYFKRPQQTAASFIDNPFGAGKLYKTGDLCRYLPNGEIEYLGRIDHQVKIRGFRIELGEIETRLLEHPDVREAVVIVREDTPNDKRLVAYLIPHHAPGTTHHADFRAHLATTLPDYMIPAAFVPLDAFPLTANGKLDRRALPLPERLAVSDGYLPPRNLLEEQLAAIWADCLQVERVGVRDDFFVLGGHSLLAVELMTRIRAVTGMQLPLATLFQRPTIEQLAQQQTDATAWSSLVAIRPNGTRPPLFCIHPVGGNVLSFYQFAQQQPADQPVYGLQSQGLDGQTPPLTTVEAMAAHYITEIKRVQPTGAYHLVGYSAGGAIAWEMGQQLRRAGETVAHLLIIDTPPKTAAPERDDSADAITWWLAMAHLGYQRFGTTPPFARADLEQLPADERVAFVLQTLQRDGVLPQGTAREVADGMLNVYKANTMAYDRYQMVADAGVQPVPITVVSTDGSGETWREFASSLRLISADGTHETLLTEPYLNQWMPFVDSPTESTN
jgi:thioesterase domain-containing protein/aryl carrier-like protein